MNKSGSNLACQLYLPVTCAGAVVYPASCHFPDISSSQLFLALVIFILLCPLLNFNSNLFSLGHLISYFSVLKKAYFCHLFLCWMQSVFTAFLPFLYMSMSVVNFCSSGSRFFFNSPKAHGRIFNSVWNVALQLSSASQFVVGKIFSSGLVLCWCVSIARRFLGVFPGSGSLTSVRGTVSLRDDGGGGGWEGSGMFWHP